jgi:hypothetical protein
MNPHTSGRRSRRRLSGYEGLCDDLVAAHPEHARFLRDRWFYHLTTAQRASCCARTWVYLSRFVSVAGLALLPAIVTLQSGRPEDGALQILAVVTSMIVALSGGVLGIARVHERWRLNHGLQEKLGRAGWDLLDRPASFAVFRATVERELATAELVYQSGVTSAAVPGDGESARGGSGPRPVALSHGAA